MINLILVLIAICLYVKGECDTKWLGKSNKNWKLTLGIPIGILGWYLSHNWIVFPICFLTYLIAGEMPYGENHWWTKLIGEDNAIIFCGAMLGLASFPILGFRCILQAIISGWIWGFVHVLDNNDKIKEPLVAILRSLGGTICLL